MARNSRLALLGRQRSDSEALVRLAANLSRGSGNSSAAQPKKLVPIFPDWIEAIEKPKKQGEITTEEARAELAEFLGVAKAFGRGQSNVLIALTQILNEVLVGGGQIEGVPPIESWQDVAAILRMMEQSGSGFKSWGETLGIQEILHMLEVRED